VSEQFTYHERFTSDELETQYNLRLGRPDYELTVIPDWQARSDTARKNLNCSLDIRYGAGEKQKLDIYLCDQAQAPTLIYFHGGYWQRGDKSIYGFLAAAFIKAGVNVVLAGYDLCPSVRLTRISEQAREAVATVFRESSAWGLNTDRLVVMGHSAGGHITEMLMGTDWSQYASDLPGDLIAAGIPISPLSLLEPVRLTQGLNSGIKMDAAEAQAQSPMLNHPPATNAPQLVAVGGAETQEFHRQAQMYVDAFSTADRKMELYFVPDVDHFDELNVLADVSSEFFKKSLSLLRPT